MINPWRSGGSIVLVSLLLAALSGCDNGPCELTCDAKGFDVVCGKKECDRDVVEEVELYAMGTYTYHRWGTMYCPDSEHSYESNWIDQPPKVEVDGIGTCTVDPEPLPEPTIVWQVETGGGAGAYSSPELVDDAIYVGHGQTVGSYATSDGGSLFNLALGGEAWARPQDGIGGLLVTSSEGVLRVVDGQTADESWSFDTAGSVYADPVFHMYIYAVSGQHLHSLTQSGEENWAFDMGAPEGERWFGGIAEANGIVYVGSTDGKLYAVDEDTGEELWSFPTGGPIHSTPVLTDNRLLFGSDDGNVYCLSASSGQLLWEYPAYASRPTWRLRPLVRDELVFVDCFVLGTGNCACALKLYSGYQEWHALTDDLAGNAGYKDSRVYYGDASGTVRGMWADDGTLIWEIELSGAADQTFPVISGTKAYVHTDEALYKLDIDL